MIKFISPLGKQLFADLYDCQVPLGYVPFIKEKMEKAAINSKATIVESVFHQFSPYGVSGVVVIAESHLAIHTWPEKNYAAIDIFTCGNVNPKDTFKYIKKYLKPKKIKVKSLYRGTRFLNSGSPQETFQENYVFKKNLNLNLKRNLS